MRWPTVSLGEICIVDWGNTSLTKSSYVDDGEYLAVSATGGDGRIGHCEHKALTPVISAIGAQCGKLFLPREDFTAIKNTITLTPINHKQSQEACCPVFLYHLLSSVQLPRRGAGQPFISKGDLQEFKITLPPLEEQRRIAAILDKAQDVKAMVAQRSCLLTALGRSLFVRRFGLPSENPYELTIHRLVDICNPKQWPTISSKQLKEAGYPVFGANGLIGYYDTFNHQAPTVLVTCRGATCGTVNVSPPNCYVTGNSMAMDNPDPALITTEYLAWVLRLRSMHDVISGSAQPQITRQGLEAVTIPVPPIDAQKDFAVELRALARVDDISRFSEVSLFEVSNCLAGQLLGSSSA
jgi:restriction endonuclease S subunit